MRNAAEQVQHFSEENWNQHNSMVLLENITLAIIATNSEQKDACQYIHNFKVRTQ
jgi:hypothetical protein